MIKKDFLQVSVNSFNDKVFSHRSKDYWDIILHWDQGHGKNGDTDAVRDPLSHGPTENI